jgi:hypothetical protein
MKRDEYMPVTRSYFNVSNPTKADPNRDKSYSASVSVFSYQHCLPFHLFDGLAPLSDAIQTASPSNAFSIDTILFQ